MYFDLKNRKHKMNRKKYSNNNEVLINHIAKIRNDHQSPIIMENDTLEL